MTTLYYNNNNIHKNYHNNNLSRLLLFHKNGKFHKSQENQRAKIMNELLISNPDLLDNFQRRYSKTPCRLRMKNSFSSKNQIKNNNNATKYTNLRIKMNRSLPCKRNQNSKQKNIKKNIRKNNTTPLMKHINEREKEKRRKERKEMDKNKIIKSHSLSNKKDKNKMQIKNKKKYENILSRSESFSIFDGKNKKNKNVKKTSDKKNINNNIYDKNENISDNKENTNNIITPINMNENICTPKNDNSNINAYNKINPVHPKVCKSPNKVNKKIYKIESLSQVGYSGPGILKYNQDNFFIYKNLNDESNVLFIGVGDGHGLVGHDVSKYLITNLPKNLNTALKKTNKYISHKETLYSTLKQVFIETNKSLCKVQSIDTKFSGSTCVTIILTKNKIISANAGDSRAVMGRYINGKWINIDLSHDQKPNNPGEKERILSHGGRIEAYKDENGGDFGPPRVWLKNEDIPGLAMSRSFGDEVAASVGTISEPEIEEYEITEDDKFIIIASDGIWEFISSQECVEFIKDFYEKKDLKGCLKFLLNESSKRWIKEEEVIDDITAVLIFFEN